MNEMPSIKHYSIQTLHLPPQTEQIHHTRNHWHHLLQPRLMTHTPTPSSHLRARLAGAPPPSTPPSRGSPHPRGRPPASAAPYLRRDSVEVRVALGVVHPQKAHLARVTGRDHVQDVVHLWYAVGASNEPVIGMINSGAVGHCYNKSLRVYSR